MTEHEHEHELITLLDEEGKEHSFVVLDIINVNSNDYVILLPSDAEAFDTEAEAGAEAVVFRIVEEDGAQTLMVVEDEDELEAVAEAWENAYDEDGLEEEEEI